MPETLEGPLSAAFASALFGAGAWLVAQAGALNRPIELVGGSILVVAAIVALRMILKAARYEREAADTTHGRLADRIDRLETELHAERDRSARLLVAYDRERQLRISLEEAGAHDRRHPAAPGPPGVRDSDYTDLGDEVHRIENNRNDTPRR